ncbi:MAG: SpoVR family protein, partial [Pseudomonadota bacterium]
LAHHEATFNEIWRTLPKQDETAAPDDDPTEEFSPDGQLQTPEENILYFLEKRSPSLKVWQREILRIVRNIAQYFYPQKQTKVMNEGCATFVHHYIMTEMHEKGLITDGAYLEFLQSHSAVVFQPEFDDQRYSGLNPYALGFAVMSDIRRICEDPSEEDRQWFPDLAGSGDWRGALKDAWENFRDESFLLQYLSPKVMRDFRLFAIRDEENDPFFVVAGIHDEFGYRRVREVLARNYDLGIIEPNIQVVAANLAGDRKLTLRHTRHNGMPLDEANRKEVLKHIHRLWGHEVSIVSE